MNIQSDCSFQVALPFAVTVDTGKSSAHTSLSKNQHLVLAAQSGCQVAFKELWDLYSRRVYRTLLGIMKNPQDAEDALQDAFLRAFVALDSFEGRANFYTWLTRIAINSALGILRKRRCRPEASLNSDSLLEDEEPQKEFRDPAPNPEQIYAGQEQHERLMQAIRRLPPQLRKATQAVITENCSMKEVAHRFNISEPAAKARLRRARIMLVSLTDTRCETRA